MMQKIKPTHITALLACMLLLSACKNDAQEEQRDQENAKVREEMESMRAELEALKRAAGENQARPTRDTGMSVRDIILQLQKYASVGATEYDQFLRASFTIGQGLLKHYNLMQDGLETIADYPYVAVVMGLALDYGPSALPKEKYLKTLLAAGASPNGFYQEQSALMLAAKYGLEDCVQILLDAGADVNATGGGNTALMMACEQGHAKCVKLLLKAKADIHIRSTSNMTAIDFAVKNNKSECKKLMEAAGAVETRQQERR